MSRKQRTVTYEDHIETLLETYQTGHYEKHQDERKAVDEFRHSLEERLLKLNDLRNELLQDRAAFLRVDVYDGKHDALIIRIQVLESWKAKATGVGAVLVLLSGAVGAAIFRALGG